MKGSTGTYGACTYDPILNGIMRSWVKMNKIPNAIDVNDYHTTLLYSRVPIEVPKIDFKPGQWVFTPTGLDVFGTETERVLVLKLNAPELVHLHDELMKLGATHDFPNYQPHVTISYDLPEDVKWQLIKVPPILFIPNKIYFESLNLLWSC